MRKVRIVKGAERAVMSQPVEVAPVVPRMTTEMIVKNWIGAAREKRVVNAQLYKSVFKLAAELASVLYSRETR